MFRWWHNFTVWAGRVYEWTTGFYWAWEGGKWVLHRGTKVLSAIERAIIDPLSDVYEAISALYAWVAGWIGTRIWPTFTAILMWVNAATSTVGKITAALVRLQQHYLPALVKYIFQTVNNWAASAYKAGSHNRGSIAADLVAELSARGLLGRLADEILTKAVQAAIDTEDPLAAVAANAIISRVISTLDPGGAVARLLSDLITGLHGGDAPKTLADVIYDLSERVTRTEAWEADYMRHGGPELRQLGDDLKEITSPAFTAALLAFFDLMISRPAGTAQVIAAAATPVNEAMIKAAPAASGGIERLASILPDAIGTFVEDLTKGLGKL